MFGPKSLLRSWFLQCVVTVILITSMNLSALPPSWWHEPDSLGKKVIDPAAFSNNFGPANIGQAKFMAKRALETLQTHAPAVANAVETDLVGIGKIIPSWDVPTAGSVLAKDQFSPLQIGQLKALADPFYRHLHAAYPVWLNGQLQTNLTKDPGNSSNYFPWTHTTADDQNRAIATVGQLKAVFSLDLTALVNPNVVINGGNMLRLSVAGKLLVRVTKPDGSTQSGVNLQFTRRSGNGGFPGGITDVNRVTNSAGEVSAADYISPEDDIIRVSLHTRQGTQTVWLPANVSLPEHIVRTGSGGSGYVDPTLLPPGAGGPAVAERGPDNQDGVEAVERLSNYLKYSAIWTQESISAISTTKRKKEIEWDPLTNQRIIRSYDANPQTGNWTPAQENPVKIVGDIFQSPGFGYEINGHREVSTNTEDKAEVEMNISCLPPVGFHEIEMERAVLWSTTTHSGGYNLGKVKLGTNPTLIRTNTPEGKVTTVLGPFVSQGPTVGSGYDNVVSWSHLVENVIPISSGSIKSLSAEAMVDVNECGGAMGLLKWRITSHNPKIWVSIHSMGTGDTPISHIFDQAYYNFTKETEIRIKVEDGTSGNLTSNIILELVDGYNCVIVKKQFVVEARSSSQNGQPPPDFIGRSGPTKTLTREESSGPKYRKIGLNGRPLADEKPQADAETDEEDEETYVDALTRELRHSTSDIYVPVPASDLALAVKRNVTAEIWNPVTDLLPSQDPTLAFGPAWRTNLAANITMVEQVAGEVIVDPQTDATSFATVSAATQTQGLLHLAGGLSQTQQQSKGLSQEDPNYAFVTDEDGSTHRFMIDLHGTSGATRSFVPAPSSVTDRPASEMSLKWIGDKKLEFKRKHGNTLVYEHCINFAINRVRCDLIGPQYGIGMGGDLSDSASEYGSSTAGGSHQGVGTGGDTQLQAYNYFRLLSVTDRLGNKLIYTYDPDGPKDMVPESIHVEGRPELVIHINSTGGKVTSVSDPKGNITTYAYPDGKLGSVQIDGIPVSSYGYKRWEETDYRKNVTKSSGLSLLQWARITSNYGGQQPGSMFQFGEMVQHLDVDEISDAANNKYKFTYRPDTSHLRLPAANFAGPPSGGSTLGSSIVDATLEDQGPATTMCPTAGYPPDVTGIELPGGDVVSIGDSGEIPPAPGTRAAYRSDKHTTVKDAEGRRRTYYWDRQVTIPVNLSGLGYTVKPGGPEAEELREMFANVSEEDINSIFPHGSRSTAIHTFYTRMTLQHDEGGYETYVFSYLAGGALKSVVDFSGNTTSFGFGEAEGGLAPPILTTALPGGITPPYSFKPTSQIDAANRIIWYTYGPHEMITRTKNVGTGLAREFGVDLQGRSLYEKVRGPSEELLSHTSIAYHTGFPGFVVRKTVENEGEFHVSGQDPSWVQPLTTLFEPDSLGRVAREANNMNGNATIDAGDLVTSYTYDRNGNKLSATDPAGNTTWFHYDKRNRLIGVVNPDGTEKRTVYDIRGKRVLEYDEKGIATGYVYDVRGRLTKTVRDMNGNLANGPSGLTGIDTGTDLIEEKFYNKVDSVVRTKDARGYISVTEYDYLQRPVKTILPAGNRPVGQIPTGSSDDEVTTFSYADEILSSTENFNPGASCFDVSGFKPTRIQDPRGYVSIFRYDNLYRLEQSRVQYSLSPALFALKENEYDTTNGTLTAVREPRQPVDEQGASAGTSVTGGREVRNYYDALLRLNKVQEEILNEGTGKTSQTETFHTATGLVKTTLRQIGATTSARTDSEYDPAGRVTKVIAPPDSLTNGTRPVVSTAYDPNGLVIQTTDPRGWTTNFVHDARGRQIQQISPAVVDPESSSTTPVAPLTDTEYDKVGNVVKVTNPRGHATVTEYDSANRPTKIKAPTYTDTQTSTLVTPLTVNTYDLAGNILTVTDPRGSVTRNTYDARGRLSNTVTNPTVPTGSTSHTDDCIVRFFWDKAGNRIRVQDAGVQHTSFEYDGLNRLTATIWDSNNESRKKTEVSEYDALVQTAKIDPRGCRTDFEYADRLLLTRSVSAGLSGAGVFVPPLDESREYDHAGRLLSVTDANDSRRNVSYGYDPLGRITSETSAGYTHTYGYDLSSNRTSVDYLHTSRSLTSSYDGLNRLEKITETDSTRETSYKYDLAGNVLRRTQANGTEEFNGYDPLGRRTFQRTWKGTIPVSLFSYFHDPVGNVTRIEEDYSSSNLPDRNVINVYDRLNRLKTEQADTLTSSSTVSKSVLTTYGYSKANNRTSRNVKVTEAGTVTSNLTESYTYGSSSNGANSNQLVSHNKAGDVTTYTYDESGNRKTRSFNGTLTDTYGWDARNRLVSVVQPSPSKTYSYGYDYRARRVVRDESAAGGDNTVVSFSGGTSAFEKVGATTAVEYIRGSDYGGGIGGVMYSIRGTTPSFNAYNGRGDVVAKTDTAGTVTWQATYEAFGTRTKEHATIPNLDRQKANTKEEDPTGLLNEGFRYRDLVTGAFISRDPLGFVDGPNVYTYVRQNPWTMFDPQGLSPCWQVNDIRGWWDPEVRAMEQSAEYKEGFNKVAQLAPAAFLAIPLALTAEAWGPAAVTKMLTPAGVYATAETTSTGVELATGYEGPPIIPGPGDIVRAEVQSSRKIVEDSAEAVSRYSGELIKVPNLDEAAEALAKKLDGQSSVRFANDDAMREFDAISEKFIAQAKPALQSIGKKFRDQAKATFEAAKETGKNVYYEFTGKPAEKVVNKLKEYSERYKVEVVVDVVEESDD